MTHLYVRLEQAAGYIIFKIQELEEVGMFLPQLEDSTSDLRRFSYLDKLVRFSPFKTPLATLENKAVSEGLLTDDVKELIDVTVPKGSKRNKITSGVFDPKLRAAITKAMNIQCTRIGADPEVIRGLQRRVHDQVKRFTKQSSSVAQLGLGNSYSRAKVTFNVHRVDNMVIQLIALLDQLDKYINTFSMRLWECYSYHFPELVKVVPDNYTYAKLAKFIKNQKTLSEESLEGLEQITMNSRKAQAILEASKSSMGMEISDIDMINIEMFASKVVSSVDCRKKIYKYVQNRIRSVSPNLANLIEDEVAARLLSKVGSLVNLAKLVASTVQILGSEKPPFRASKTRGNTPKYGLLYNASYIRRANHKNKGTIASRIDCFADDQSNVFSEKMKEQVEERLALYENRTASTKNVEAMIETLEVLAKVKKAHKKKIKNRKFSAAEVSITEAVGGESSSKTKKKEKIHSN